MTDKTTNSDVAQATYYVSHYNYLDWSFVVVDYDKSGHDDMLLFVRYGARIKRYTSSMSAIQDIVAYTSSGHKAIKNTESVGGQIFNALWRDYVASSFGASFDVYHNYIHSYCSQSELLGKHDCVKKLIQSIMLCIHRAIVYDSYILQNDLNDERLGTDKKELYGDVSEYIICK